MILSLHLCFSDSRAYSCDCKTAGKIVLISLPCIFLNYTYYTDNKEKQNCLVGNMGLWPLLSLSFN